MTPANTYDNARRQCLGHNIAMSDEVAGCFQPADAARDGVPLKHRIQRTPEALLTRAAVRLPERCSPEFTRLLPFSSAGDIIGVLRLNILSVHLRNGVTDEPERLAERLSDAVLWGVPVLKLRAILDC